MSYRVIVAGSRGFGKSSLLYAALDNLLSKVKENDEIVIVSGGANGADKLGEQYAKERGYKLQVYPADWDQYGKAAGPIRNKQMAENADALVAFWDGKSRGTKNMIDEAAKHGLKRRIVFYNEETE